MSDHYQGDAMDFGGDDEILRAASRYLEARYRYWHVHVAGTNKLEVIGGPADGLWLSPRAGSFWWIDVDGIRSDEPREGAEMYRRKGRTYLHCEQFWRRCVCGAVVPRMAIRCQLCGQGRR